MVVDSTVSRFVSEYHVDLGLWTGDGTNILGAVCLGDSTVMGVFCLGDSMVELEL